MARTKKSKPGNRAKGDKMPRPPPLPPGLPPRPAAPRGDVSGGDSYRPREPSSPGRRDAPGQSGGMYHFRGAASAPGTSYRPSYDDQRMRSPPRLRSPPRYNDSGFRPAYDSPARDDYHSYRPTYNDNRDRHDRGDRNEGFTFRQELPPNIDFDQAHKYRARSPRRQREYESGDSYRANNRANTQRGGLRGGYRGRGGPRMASERDFLKTNRAKTPELMPGMDIEQGNITYKDVDNMSDSDEAEMDLSNSDEEADDDQPRKKQKTTTDSNSVPRWSNPDPYTVLPPPDATDRKKKDVVKLIRKARVTSGLENATKTVADTDDFISFGFDEDDKDDTQTQSGIGVEGAPTGPRSSGFQNLPPSPENSLKTAPSSTNYQQLPPLPPGLPNKPKDVTSNKKTSRTIDLTMDPNLGTRKRTRNDVLKPPPQIHGPTPGKGASKPEGNIVKAWKPLNGVTPTPWIALDHSNSANFGVWLHKEIIDFYHYVKPRDFEGVIRQKLIDDLRIKVKNHFDRNADIMAFGSFPAGLYLPTADMDLVCVSQRYLQGGSPRFTGKRVLWQFEAFLRAQKLALNDKIEVISGAKVPLVKYVCATTGLKVDISFENDTGLIANKTFQDWKAEFPAMPILVTLIKHLLAMRGLNEPVNGGIGGFSVICLVVSLLQHMPQVQSRSMIPEHHLGEVLMEFLDLYGNQFNTATTAIQLKPPSYIPKTSANVPYKQPQQAKFCIIDPNRSDNDISGGSSNTMAIRRAFSDSFDKLQRCMGEIQSHHDHGLQSLLSCIIGGNYSTFELQREHLAHVHEHLLGPIDFA